MVWMLLLGNQYILKTKQPEYLYGSLCIHYLPHLSQGSIQQLWWRQGASPSFTFTCLWAWWSRTSGQPRREGLWTRVETWQTFPWPWISLSELGEQRQGLEKWSEGSWIQVSAATPRSAKCLQLSSLILLFSTQQRRVRSVLSRRGGWLLSEKGWTLPGPV